MDVLKSKQARYISWVLSDLDRLYSAPHALNQHTLPDEIIESEFFNTFVKPYILEKPYRFRFGVPTKQINVMYFSMNEENTKVDGVMWQPLHVPACYDYKTLIGFLNQLIRKGVEIKEEAVEASTLVIVTFDPEVFADLRDSVQNFIRLLEYAAILDPVE